MDEMNALLELEGIEEATFVNHIGNKGGDEDEG